METSVSYHKEKKKRIMDLYIAYRRKNHILKAIIRFLKGKKGKEKKNV